MATTDDPRPAGTPPAAPGDRPPSRSRFDQPPSSDRPRSDEEAEEARAGSGARIGDAWGGLSAGRRRFVALGVVLTLIGAAIAVWFALSATVNKPNWRDMAFEVPSDDLVRVRFEVTKPPDMTAVCTLLAQEVNHAVVGRTTVVIPPADQRTTWHEAEIRTTAQATIGTVRTCHEQEPGQ